MGGGEGPDGRLDIIGFQRDDDDGTGGAAFGISSSSRIHTAVFGLVGSGKSSILKLLILQNIKRHQGFMVVDPHGELARDILSLVPSDRHDDIIYVNPASLYRFGGVIRINPLEVGREEERYLVVMTFVNALYNLYRESWGPRLETILRNAANALVETPHNTLGNLSAMITDAEARRTILEKVSSREVRRFWSEIYDKQYSKDAGSSAYNKIDKILTTPAVAAMFDAAESSVRFSDIIENRRMLVVDLSTGASDDVAAFVGTVLLNMLYVEAKKRLDLGDGEMVRANPFYVYVDEAHMFSNLTMSEMLRALRKFGVRMTIATQTANAYARGFADEITGICQAVICGHCDGRTASLLSPVMPVGVRDLERLPNHMFAFYSAEGGRPVTGVVRTRPVPGPGQDRWDWREVARHSVARWGEPVSASRYLPRGRSRLAMMTPLEAALLEVIRGRPGQDRDGVIRGASHLGSPREAASALADVLVQGLGYAEQRGAGYHVTKRALQSYYSQAGLGRRAGGDLHLRTIFWIMEHNMRAGRYCIPDLGDKGGDRPDLLIMEPASRTDSKGRRKLDGHAWSEKTIVAVEVETAPSKHSAQIIKNYRKNTDAGYNVWFVVFKDNDHHHIANALEGIEGRHPFEISIVDADMAGAAGADPPGTPFLVTEYAALY